MNGLMNIWEGRMNIGRYKRKRCKKGKKIGGKAAADLNMK